MTQDTGGPAFPFDEKEGNGNHWHSHAGMTLLDWFAGQALTGIVTTPDAYGSVVDDATCAAKAFDIAEALLAEKRRREAQP